MASTVGGLDSIDLLDLLFDRQDGILRGVELGTTSPGTWHEDGRAQDGEDFLSSILGSGDSISDSPSWSPGVSDSGVSEDPPSDQLDSPPGCCDGGLSEAPYAFTNSCQVLTHPGGTGAPHPEVSIDLDMWNPGFFLEEGRGLSTVPVPASCTLTVKDLLLSGSSDAVSPHHRVPHPCLCPVLSLPRCHPRSSSVVSSPSLYFSSSFLVPILVSFLGPLSLPSLLIPATSWTMILFLPSSLPVSPPLIPLPELHAVLFLSLTGCHPQP